MDTSPTALVPLALPPEHLCSIPGRSPGDGRRGLPQRRSLRSASLRLGSLGRSWERKKISRERDSLLPWGAKHRARETEAWLVDLEAAVR